MMEMQLFRGPRALYSIRAHGDGIYFATDTKEIILNGLSFLGNIPEELAEVIVKSEANRAAIDILNGNGEGSVDKKISDAINEFASNISDDNTVNTFKELLEYAANNTSDVGNLIVSINDVKSENEQQNLLIESLETNLKTTEQSLLLKIEGNETAIANLSKEVDNKIETAFSWQNVN